MLNGRTASIATLIGGLASASLPPLAASERPDALTASEPPAASIVAIAQNVTAAPSGSFTNLSHDFRKEKAVEFDAKWKALEGDSEMEKTVCIVEPRKPLEVNGSFLHDSLIGSNEVKFAREALANFAKANIESPDYLDSPGAVESIDTLLKNWGRNGRPALIDQLSITNEVAAPESYDSLLCLTKAVGREARKELDNLTVEGSKVAVVPSEKYRSLARVLFWAQSEFDRLSAEETRIATIQEPEVSPIIAPASASKN